MRARHQGPRSLPAPRETLIRSAVQQLAYHRGCGDKLVGLVVIDLLTRLSVDLIDEGTEAVAGRLQLTRVDIALSGVELCEQTPLRAVWQSESLDIGGQSPDRRRWWWWWPRWRGRHETIDRQPGWRGKRVDERLADAHAVEVRASDRVQRRAVRPPDVRAVDGDPLRPAGGDEKLVHAVAIEVGAPDPAGAGVHPVDEGVVDCHSLGIRGTRDP